MSGPYPSIPRHKEKHIAASFFIAALFSLGSLSAIVFFLFDETYPIFDNRSLMTTLFGQDWISTMESSGFGLGLIVVPLLAATVLAGVIAVPVGIYVATHLHKLSSSTRHFLRISVELLAALPSVVIGFVGLLVVGVSSQSSEGISLVAATILLAAMAVPTICSLCHDALLTTHSSRVWPSFCTASLLGISRAFGETLIVLATIGGALFVPKELYDAAQASNGLADHYFVLLTAGALLFLMTLLFNAAAFHNSKCQRASRIL